MRIFFELSSISSDWLSLTRTSLTCSRRVKAINANPSGSWDCMSLALCTAISVAPLANCSSSSRVKTPLLPILAMEVSRTLSPMVSMALIVVSIPTALRASATISVCHIASLLFRDPMTIILSFFLCKIIVGPSACVRAESPHGRLHVQLTTISPIRRPIRLPV